MWLLIFKKYWWILLLLIVPVLFYLKGRNDGYQKGYGKGFEDKQCPEITVGETIVVDTIKVYDTIPVEVGRDDVDLKVKTRIVYLRDTTTNKVESVEDSNYCYSLSLDTLGASIAAEVCSRYFPVRKPIDLTGSINYVPPPDTNRITMRIDTVTYRYNKPPWYKDKRVYLTSGISIGFGIAGTILYLKYR